VLVGARAAESAAAANPSAQGEQAVVQALANVGSRERIGEDDRGEDRRCLALAARADPPGNVGAN
jgi:hypothetical protein